MATVHIDESGERSMTELVRDIAGNAQEIVRSEIRLARTEIKEESIKAAKAGALLGGGALIGLFGLNFFFWSLIFGLSTWVPMSGSALAIAVLLGITGLVLVLAGRDRMKEVKVKPERTVNALREDVEWLRNQTR